MNLVFPKRDKKSFASLVMFLNLWTIWRKFSSSLSTKSSGNSWGEEDFLLLVRVVLSRFTPPSLDILSFNSIQSNLIIFDPAQFESMKINAAQSNSVQCNSFGVVSVPFDPMQFDAARWDFDRVQIGFTSIQPNSNQSNSIHVNSIQFHCIQS